jgi:carbonic anhydrase
MGSHLEEKDTPAANDRGILSPTDALNLLLAGNRRFVSRRMLKRDFPTRVARTATAHHPFASVLACMDSRVPAEIVLDQGVGDVYMVRMAGVVVDSDVLGSLEYAAAFGGSKLTMVLGHTDCGAVKGACDGLELGSLTSLLMKIAPAVTATETDGPRDSTNREFVDAVAYNNVKLTVEKILRDSTIISELARKGEILVVGAMYDVRNGHITLVED